MKKIYYPLLLLLLTVFALKVNAQSANKFFYGGNIGFSIESNYWMLNVSPLVGYRFTPSFSGGVSALYEYESFKKSNPDYTVNSYGGGAFLRYDLGANLMKDLPFSIFFQTDYEGRQRDVKFKSTSHIQYNDYSKFENRLYLGAGIFQSLGSRTRAFLMISIDMLHLGGENSAQPVIRAGVEF